MKVKTYNAIALTALFVALGSVVLGACGNLFDIDSLAAIAMITFPASLVIFIIMCVIRPALQLKSS